LIVQGIDFVIASTIPGSDPKNENMQLIRTFIENTGAGKGENNDQMTHKSSDLSCEAS
jgi:hypothetical protein